MSCNFQPGVNLYSMLCGEIAISTRGGWRGGGGVGGAGRGGMMDLLHLNSLMSSLSRL